MIFYNIQSKLVGNLELMRPQVLQFLEKAMALW